VLKPSSVPGRRPLQRELYLRLANNINNGSTSATLDGREVYIGDGHIVIQ